MRKLVLLLASSSPMLLAQPIIYNRSVVNAASFLPWSIPGGSIAQGSIFTIFGANLGPANGVTATSFPLSTTLSNVSITIQGTTSTVNAIPIYVSAGQVNAIMPSNTPLDWVSLRVLVGNARSNPVPVRVEASAPGVFTVRGYGAGPGAIHNFVTPANQPFNAPATPAKPGQTVTLYGTGLGPVSSDTTSPPVGTLPVGVEVFVGGISVSPQYAGRAPGFAGEDQINFQVPLTAPSGCWVPVYLRVAGQVVSNVVTMAITSNGSPCTAPTAASAALLKGGKLAVLAPMRVDINQSPPNSPLDLRSDYLMARLANEATSTFPFSTLLSLPPPGTCTAYAGPGDWFTSDPAPGIQPSIGPLDGGAFTVSGSASATFPMTYSPLTIGYLGSSIPVYSPDDDTILAPGSVLSVKSQGGADVAAINTTFTMVTPLTWTNRDQISAISRSAGFTVNWNGGGGQTVAIVGGSVDLPTNASAVFVCIAAPGANSFTVPPVILSNLPPSRGNPLSSKGILFLVNAAKSAPFTVSGVNSGVIAPVYLVGKAVSYQ